MGTPGIQHSKTMPELDLPIRAATETLLAHGIEPERCEILQNGSTLVVRLTEDLVVRVVQDLGGPRQTTEWFKRENALAEHLTRKSAPVIPLHAALPPGPHEHLGYGMNFWKFVTRIDTEPEPGEIGRTLARCHDLMRDFDVPLPKLAILSEALEILESRELFPNHTQQMLMERLKQSLDLLDTCPHQPLHGDAHPGNLMNTTDGLLWTDWEDTFSGPVEWDLASLIWNAKILDEDEATVLAILKGYHSVSKEIDPAILHQCLVARAAVMTAWYPILYPNPDNSRTEKLRRRIEWLETVEA